MPEGIKGFVKGHKINSHRFPGVDTKTRMSIAQKGSKCHRWKGGKFIDFHGYVHVHTPNHPYKNARGYVREHRLVMESHLGRYLHPKERVHHINEIKHDNRIENLMYFPSESEHVKHHHSLKPLKNSHSKPRKK